MKPEFELLLCAIRGSLDARRRERVLEILRLDLDWDLLLRSSLHHGVLPLLVHQIQALDVDLVPEDRWQQCRAYFSANASQTLYMTREMANLTAALRKRQIPNVHFKGAVLAAHAYKNPVLRQYGDLDVVVHKQDAPKVRDYLLASGYESVLSKEAEAEHYQHSYWWKFKHSNGIAQLDLHWKLADDFDRYEPALDGLWARLQEVEVAGQQVMTFGPEDSVLVLVAHGFKHGWSRLKWLCDLGEWLRCHPDLDWSWVRQEARSLPVQRIFAMSMLLVHRWEEGLVPAEVIAECQSDKQAQALSNQVWQRLFSGQEPTAMQIHWLHLRGRERTRDRLPYLNWQVSTAIAKVFKPNEKDRATVALPRGLGFCYYFLRPFRLLGNYIRASTGGTHNP